MLQVSSKVTVSPSCASPFFRSNSCGFCLCWHPYHCFSTQQTAACVLYLRHAWRQVFHFGCVASDFLLLCCSACACTPEMLNVCQGNRDTHSQLDTLQSGSWALVPISDGGCCITSTGDAEQRCLVDYVSDIYCIFFIIGQFGQKRHMIVCRETF